MVKVRDDSFLRHLEALLQLEAREEAERLAAMTRDLSLGERAALGYALIDLICVDEQFGLGGRLQLILRRDGGGRMDGGIDSGDIVRLRPRRGDGEAAIQCVVARRTAGEIAVVLSSDDAPPAWVHAGRCVLELVGSEVTYRRMREGLSTVRRTLAGSGTERRRVEVLLGQAPPRQSRAATEESDVDRQAAALNDEQQAAVRGALQAEDFYLVHGPPGTGKSTVLATIAQRAVARGDRVLVTAASNAAVDHLMSRCRDRGLRVVRLGHPARVAERLASCTLAEQVAAHADYQLAMELTEEAYGLRGYARKQRSRGRSADRFAHARQAHTDARTLLSEARELERRATADVLSRAQVICATLAGLSTQDLTRHGIDRLDLALIDEATQATEPLTWLAFLRARRLVLAGDHKQLPPTVLSQAAADGGLGVSLFERLLSDLRTEGQGALHQMLREQHRMHAEIMAFPSIEMYGGALRAHPEAATRTLQPLLRATGAGGDLSAFAPPLLVIDTAGKGWDDEVAPGTGSRHNRGEADLIMGRLRRLLDAGLQPRDIAIIAPYSAQVALLRDLVLQVCGDSVAAELEVDSIDAFQGREKEAVLVSLTRSGQDSDGARIGFLSDVRRINVALTRARRHLLVIGDSATLAQHPFYERLFSHAQNQGAYQSAWELD